VLTRQQVADIARVEGLPLHTVERDYVQHLILRHTARRMLVFKGGTCLRIAYHSPRYSEDLDFDARCSRAGAEDLFRGAARRLGDYGIKASVVGGPASRTNFNVRIRYEGPLFDGAPLSRGTVRIESSLRGGDIDSRELFVPRTPYPDVPQLILRVLTSDHLFAEKARALIIRKKPRDLFDLHFLLHRDITCRRTLLDEKMSLYKRRFTLKALDEAVRAAEETWERDLGSLLSEVPPYASVSRDVKSAFRERFGPRR
jgi:predicted nucleotidyltransferase component of viral defense system